MSGESAIAKDAIARVIASIKNDDSKSADAILFALLSQTLNELLATRSRDDIEQYISFHMNNYDETDWVITRGC